MCIEIERKFLVKFDHLDRLIKESFGRIQITQSYLANTNQCDVRVRTEHIHMEPSSYRFNCMTIKSKSLTGTRSEVNIEIDDNQARELMLMVPSDQQITKTRYVLEGLFDQPCSQQHPRCITVDVFSGTNLGLVLLEAELYNTDVCIDDILPFVDREVTHDERYYNSYLSDYPFSRWPQ